MPQNIARFEIGLFAFMNLIYDNEIEQFKLCTFSIYYMLYLLGTQNSKFSY